MKFSELDEKTQEKALENIYPYFQEHMIWWEDEHDGIKEHISEILEKYHCYHKEGILYEYDYYRVHFPTINPSLDIEELLKEEESLLELYVEIQEVTDGYSEIQISFSSYESTVEFYVGYSLDEYEKAWDFIKKYADELELEISNINIPIIFGSNLSDFRDEIRELLDKVLELKGNEIAEHISPKIEKMREEIVNFIEESLSYLVSEEYVREYLMEIPEQFDFDAEGNRLLDAA